MDKNVFIKTTKLPSRFCIGLSGWIFFSDWVFHVLYSWYKFMEHDLLQPQTVPIYQMSEWVEIQNPRKCCVSFTRFQQCRPKYMIVINSNNMKQNLFGPKRVAKDSFRQPKIAQIYLLREHLSQTSKVFLCSFTGGTDHTAFYTRNRL